MRQNKERSMKSKSLIAVSMALLLISSGASLVAQDVAQGSSDASALPAQAFSPDQLNAMVAPIALYPDNLLSQLLVASTYPLEVVEAGQWLRQNGNLRGQQLVDAARQQNWDPSIQALVVFPDVLNRLNSDIRWTTDLGNAFLAQQADVMSAVQHMRAEARANGKLNSNSQETVTAQTQGDQTAIQIQPADPQVVYVPTYNPEYVWGPPVYGYYPPLFYPGVGFGFGFGPGIYIGGFFGGLGWGGWGWGPNWFGGSIFVNGFFFNHYGFRGGWYGGHGIWAHNPEHRMGVAYSNQRVASRFGGNFAGRSTFASHGAYASHGTYGNTYANRGSNTSPRGYANGGNSGSRFQGSQAPSAMRSSQGNGFRSSGSQPSYRSNPAYGGGNGRAATPSYHSNPSSGGGGSHAAPSASHASSFHSGGGSSFHGGGGGGGAHGGGGHR
jgi:hypothetical protein